MSGTEVYLDKLPSCIFCKEEGRTRDAKYDGATRQGPWAFMCEEHFKINGRHLGTGVGQRLYLIEGSMSGSFSSKKK